MTRLADIEGHIGSMRELLNLVGAMRSLAGMRMQEAQRSLPGIRHYAKSLTTALAGTLMLMTEPQPRQHRNPRARLALVLCTSEHGFVGGFNEQLLDAAERRSQPMTWSLCSAAVAPSSFMNADDRRRGPTRWLRGVLPHPRRSVISRRNFTVASPVARSRGST
jgi:hypothetical protein